MSVGGVQLADGRAARYPSLDGQGIAVDPHQERPNLTWVQLTERFGLEVALQLQEQAAIAEQAHLVDGCDLEHQVR